MKITYWIDKSKLVRYEGLLNALHSLDFRRLTHPTGTFHLKCCNRKVSRDCFTVVRNDKSNALF
ncbi:hypothetical protein [Dapis sp. BLCC M126]|uniref:hypothetical protein n=1 Tax=Dapis sp. BLCC M126 TaxID=3400189 RepID=UPI003CF7D48C